MRRTLALLLTTWQGVVVTALILFGEIFLFAFLITFTPFRYGTEWWPIWLILCLVNGLAVSSLWTFAEKLRAEGKAILAAKVDNDPEEPVG